jgi:hypothetical protein
MRFLRLISCLVLLSGCAGLYKNLPRAPVDGACLQKFSPVFESVLYNAYVDVTSRHLSGLLLIKKMPDNSTRLVFSGETGVTYFDFAFSDKGDFKVNRIIEQMNKKPVIKTLRKDFELVMLQHPEKASYSLRDSAFSYIAFPQKKGVYYYITDTGCERLIRMERASRTKVVVVAVMQNPTHGSPDSISISHKNFHLDIGLKKINRQQPG